MSVDTAKQAAAVAAVNDSIDDNVRFVGIGSGTTIIPAVKRIAEMVHNEGRDLICVPTSFQARDLILSNGLKLGNLNEHFELDVAIDGADEVDENFNCIKGGGGCQTQEKLVAFAAKKFVVIADSKKWTKNLGDCWKKGIPIEVLPIATQLVKRTIERNFGGEVLMRQGTGKLGPVLSDQGNFLIDWKFPESEQIDWQNVNEKLKMIPGVVETGLFLNMISKAYFGNSDGNVEIKINSRLA